MIFACCYVVALLSATTLSAAVPHVPVDKPLSSQNHYADDGHNDDYDHEAFLGREEADEFDQLSADESKRRLGILVNRIDKDNNDLVSETELIEWIKYTQERYVLEDVASQWESFGSVDSIDWDRYKKVTYGYERDEDPDEDERAGFSYKKMLQRDERRWARADADGDKKLSKAEYGSFLHPEDAPHMLDVVVQETMEDIDKDGDGGISLDEYIGDMYVSVEGQPEPDWVAQEREQFGKFRDTDGDGKMGVEEVKAWILPPDFDHSQAEARHLIFEADADKDGQLSKEEIIEKHDLFAGSQATDFGEALSRHDEF
ncbi:PREDICTED: calumenin-B-like [Priapulus caudatus]|uniref:Calumenin-B-like n=1 Tax=Priapulus caudatus TaxID=37621 RepID=A0ABM1EX47_PRICU|nr:PREDICTED: calumenin-B-like [Priapulus caudatus]